MIDDMLRQNWSTLHSPLLRSEFSDMNAGGTYPPKSLGDADRVFDGSHRIGSDIFRFPSRKVNGWHCTFSN